MKLKITALVFLFFFTTNSFSGEPPFRDCQALGCIGKIDRIVLHQNGDIHIPTMGENADKLDCQLFGNAYITLKRDHVHFKEMYSMLLAAHTAQKNVLLRIASGSADCEVLYSVIY